MDFYGFMIFSIFMVSDLWIKMLTKRSKKIMEKAKNEELGVA